jgi:hypothetical protein
MANGDRPVHITRGEFSRALVLVWLYIMLVMVDLLRLEWRWTTGILFLASFFMVIAYLVQSYRDPWGSPSRTIGARQGDRERPVAED